MMDSVELDRMNDADGMQDEHIAESEISAETETTTEEDHGLITEGEDEHGLSLEGGHKRKVDEMEQISEQTEEELIDGSTKKFSLPTILYHDGNHGIAKVLMTEDPVLGNIYYDSNDYKYFRTEDSMESILKKLSDDDVLDQYANESMPSQFQGTASAVVRMNDAQKADAVDFLRDDGNGGWKQSRTGNGQVWNTDLTESRPFIRIYYRSDTAAGFKRIVAYFVPNIASREVAANFAVVMYYWSDGKIPQPFTCKKQRPATPGKPREEGKKEKPAFCFAQAPTLERIRLMQQKFVEARDWQKFHTPRNLVMAMVGEVGEVAELFQWKGEVEAGLPDWDRKDKGALEQELADVMIYLIRLADVCKVNLPKAIEKKMQINAARYPVDKVYGSCKKYTEYAKKK